MNALQSRRKIALSCISFVNMLEGLIAFAADMINCDSAIFNLFACHILL
jgi:hypothetical protein